MKKIIIFTLISLVINMSFCFSGVAKQLLLETGTKVKLKNVDRISSHLNDEGDTVNFIVADNIKQGDTTLIKEGARATGVVSEIRHKGRMGKEGFISVDLDYAIAIDGQKIPLYGNIEKYGENKAYEYSSVNLVAGGIIKKAIFIITIPYLILIKGEDAQLAPGYQYKARVEKDLNISIDDGFVPVSNR